MATLNLAARRRTVLGKKVASLRRAGRTPANIYGHNVESTAIDVDSHDLTLLVRRAGHTSLISLAIEQDGAPRSVLVREIQRKATTGQILHVDFIQVSMTEKLTVSVPLRFVGQAPILDSVNATVVYPVETVDVECLPAEIPAHLDVDLSVMTETTSVLHVRDLTVPSGVTVIADPDVVIASITLTRAEVAEEAAAEEAAGAEAAAAEVAPAAAEEEQTE